MDSCRAGDAMFRGSKPQDENHRTTAASSTQCGGREASHSTSAAPKFHQSHIFEILQVIIERIVHESPGNPLFDLFCGRDVFNAISRPAPQRFYLVTTFQYVD